MVDVLPTDSFAAGIAEARSQVSAGNVAAAIEILGRLIRGRPGNPEALRLLGSLAERLNKPEDAASVYRVLVQADPSNPEHLRALGHALEKARDWKGVEECRRKQLAHAPADYDAWISLADSLHKQERFHHALEVLETVRKIFPGDHRPLLKAASFYRDRNRYQAAEAICKPLVRDHPADPDVWISAGVNHHAMERNDEAEACFRRALDIDPSSVNGHFALAFHVLSLGRWREGFEEFRWCTKLAEVAADLAAMPEWTGGEPPGTRVIVWSGQGYGDAIQFLRHVRNIAANGHKPVLYIPRALVRLAETVAGAASVHASADPRPDGNVQIALHNLPHAVGVRDPGETWPGPYLTPPPQPVLPRSGKLAVGLTWAGRPDFANDSNRSIPLSALAPLLDVPGIQWFGLQTGKRASEAAGTPWAEALHDLSPRITDFADTAALVGGLDLVISVDTSVAHLAGALGKPVWILLPRRCDWRWLRHGASTGWYPSARLFRQATFGYWAPVVAEMAEALAAMAETRHQSAPLGA
ncbi:MAG: tetratricopeptide repeat-containing glycosyltransferase family protein [Magnetospirillum sp.]|nr:tetratricopeptide repeat-containing glycosyltransferase family protein [Magnetospirillum sp.]